MLNRAHEHALVRNDHTIIGGSTISVLVLLAALSVVAYFHQQKQAKASRSEDERKKRSQDYAENQRQAMLANPLALAGHALLFGTERERWRGSASEGGGRQGTTEEEEETGLSMTPIGSHSSASGEDGGDGGYGTALEAGFGVPDEI
jgi:hypothetical protein